jgi:hypothetical protein
MDAKLKEIIAEMKVCRKETMVCQEVTEACLGETEATIKTGQEPREDLMNVSLEATETCLEKIEANQRKAENKMEACLGEMEVETAGAPEGRSRGKQPGVEYRSLRKTRNKDDVVMRRP